MVQQAARPRIEAGRVTFIVQHELWDGNVQDHSDQGVVILVVADDGGKETTLLRFNCFDLERSYVYGPVARISCSAWTQRWTATRWVGA